MDARPRILVVEDNADLRRLLEQLLRTDYLVATAGRGEAGVALAGSFLPDLIILDLHLPDIDGAEVGRRIKRQLRDVPVLVLSATATPEGMEALHETGCCDAFLAKPATIAAIRSAIAELLGFGTGAQG